MTDLNPFAAVQACAQRRFRGAESTKAPETQTGWENFIREHRAPVMPDAALAAALADKAMREADPMRAVGDLSDALLVQARALVAERLRRDLADEARGEGENGLS